MSKTRQIQDSRQQSWVRILSKYSSTSTEYFQSTRVRVLSTSEVLEYEYEYFSTFYKSTRV